MHAIVLGAFNGISSLVPRPFIEEKAWQLTWVQTVYGYDVKNITAAHVKP